jgi:gamma-glutamyltranspeptidase/glutathione hydrolase
MNANNGFMTLDDLKNYKINAGAPISVSYRGNTVFAPGAPSGGGIVLLTALNILQNYKFKDQDSNATRTYHLLAESLRRGHNNRSHHIGDPAFYDVPTEKLISRARTIELLKNFKFKTATPSSKIKPMSVVNESRDTTHYSIVDSEGNAVSNTYTLGYSFGSGVTIPGTGILMNNQMNNFAYRYGDKSVQGRAASPGNQFAPGKRPMSTMTPTMVFDKSGQLMLITGSPGGSFIPAAVLRVVSGVIDFNLNIGEATMLPRIHKDWPYTGLDYESILSSDISRQLDSMGHKTEAQKTMGSTQSIHIHNGLNYGYADLRRPGAAVSVQK